MAKTEAGTEEAKIGKSYTEKTFPFIVYNPCSGSEGITNFNSIKPDLKTCSSCGRPIGPNEGQCSVTIKMV